MKLLPGDHVAQAGLTDEQYHAIAKKFMEAGANVCEYRTNRSIGRGYQLFGWLPDNGLYHGDMSFKKLGSEGRLLTPSQLLEDNWYERGELPPAGTICEAHNNGRDWEPCKILAIATAADGDPECIYQMEGDWEFSKAPEHFRPLRTPKEKTIEAVRKELNSIIFTPKGDVAMSVDDHNKRIAEHLYKAGLLKEVE